jgi:hypothetical protein
MYGATERTVNEVAIEYLKHQVFQNVRLYGLNM